MPLPHRRLPGRTIQYLKKDHQQARRHALLGGAPGMWYYLDSWVAPREEEAALVEFLFRPMDQEHAHAIAKWRYPGIYSFYDADQDPEDLRELLDPRKWADRYFAVVDDVNELVGFFSFEKGEGGVLTIGLGLKPDHTGKGLGQAFVAAGLAFAREEFRPRAFRLSVATFNKRAIMAYERAGFVRDGVFMNETNGGRHEFLRMVRNA